MLVRPLDLELFSWLWFGRMPRGWKWTPGRLWLDLELTLLYLIVCDNLEKPGDPTYYILHSLVNQESISLVVFTRMY
jgi:hypothetical protein